MRIACFGDIVGRPGREALRALLPVVKKEHNPDLVLANVENLAHGFGITPKTVEEVFEAGVDICTSGNHIWKNAKGVELLAKKPDNILQPANAKNDIGRGHTVLEIRGVTVVVINLLGEVFMKDEVEPPFQTFDALYNNYGPEAVYIVDLHAEATGEKHAFAHYVDNRATLVYGTHTHVQTADERLLPGGTAYITDLGHSGAFNSSLGMDTNLVLKKIVEGMRVSLEPPSEVKELVLRGIIVEVNEETKTAENIERIDLHHVL